MIEGIGIGEVERRIRIDRPSWVDAGVHQEASWLLKTLDPRVSGAFKAYVRMGTRTDVHGNGLTTFDVMDRIHCDYLKAIEIVSLAFRGRMSAYEELARYGVRVA